MQIATVDTLHTLSIARSALTILFALAILFVTPAITIIMLRRTNSVRQNFRGERIPAMFGLSIAVSSILLLALSVGYTPLTQTSVLRWIALLFCFSTLGFIDDKWGDKEIKGLKGHFGAAWRDHRITSGLIKAIGGVIAGLLLGYWLYPSNPLKLVASGMVIALGANGMNLLDLRPGRACAMFLICSTALLALAGLYITTPHVGEMLLVCVMLPTLPAWILDSRAIVMLGDTGSNALGASLGLAIVESNSMVLEAVAITILIVLHFVAERRSITQIIANNKILDTIDKLTGLRE